MSDVGSEIARAQQASGGQLVAASGPEFAKLLPRHISEAKFTRWCLTLARQPDIAKVMTTDDGRLSVMSALMDCASLGLEPGRTYHLVVFGGKVTGITDYKGEIELITNADPAACVIAQLVRERDDFHMTGANIPPKHDADWFGDRGEVTGGYAYIDYGGRCSQVIRMSEAEFQHHKAKAKTKTVWDEWPDAMRLKTLVHQLRKWVPWSPEVTR